MTSEIEQIGKSLAQIRKEKGFTQIELAEKLGVLQVVVSDYERGRTRITAEILLQIAKVLEISVDEILGLKKQKAADKQKGNRKIFRRLEQIEKLNPKQQQNLLHTIDTYLRGTIQLKKA
ncbi:MAG: helix-turn-helix transcriptional regulator [Deltaproteobacteria bacterium]|nr:helix-turn-helix transcriptional regulator [Deltaproteobacteria bacterium]